jgi:hypothetical protein
MTVQIFWRDSDERSSARGAMSPKRRALPQRIPKCDQCSKIRIIMLDDLQEWVRAAGLGRRNQRRSLSLGSFGQNNHSSFSKTGIAARETARD